MERNLYRQMVRREMIRSAVCEQKRHYPNKKIAQQAAKAASNRAGEFITAYRCQHCDKGWCIGHPTR